MNRASIPDPELRAWLIGRTNHDHCAERGQPDELADRRVRSIREAVERGVRHEEVEAIPGRDGH